MTQLELIAVERMIGCTANPVDRQKNLIIYRGMNRNPRVLQMILDARMRWLNWLTIAQRDWQSKTRNKNKARHHDSISLREEYVRCNYTKPA